MLGQRVGGYEVKSILASGRRTLYLAVNSESGHRAAIRAFTLDDTGASFDEFAGEVAAFLSLASRPEVVARRLDDGREVLFAAVDPSAPGTGETRFPVTTRIERSPRPRRSRRGVSFALAALLAFLLLGLGLWRRQQVELPPVALVVAPPPSAPPNLALAPPEPERPVPAQVVPVVETPRGVTARKATTSDAPCDPSDEWKKNRIADVQELELRVQGSDTLWKQEQPHLDQLSKLVSRARDPQDCRAVEASLKKVVARLVGSD